MDDYCRIHDIYSTPCPFCEVDRLSSELERVTKERDTWERLAKERFDQYIKECSNSQSFAKELADKRSELERYKKALEEIYALTEHNIPFYGYGDNQAACEIANRLDTIQKKAQEG